MVEMSLAEKNKFYDIGVVLFLFLLSTLFLKDILFTGKVYYGMDMYEYYPQRSFLYEWVKKGTIPLWNPYVGCGTPCAADDFLWGIFYPLNALFLILPINLAFSWTIELHIFLGGVFMYLCARVLNISRFGSTISSLVFMLGGAMIITIYSGEVNILCAYIWIPAIFASFNRALECGRKWIIWTGISIAMQILGGHPQIVFYTLCLLFLYSFAYILNKKDTKSPWRVMGILCSTVSIGILLSSIHLLPVSEAFLFHSVRTGGVDTIFAYGQSFPADYFLTYIVPDFFGNPVDNTYWGPPFYRVLCKYNGIFPLVLSAIAAFFVRSRTTRFFAFISFIAAFLSLGGYNPFHRFLFTHLPGYNMFGIPARWQFLLAFSIPLLSGIGWDFLVTSSESKIRGFSRVRLLLWIIFFFMLTVLLTCSLIGEDRMGEWMKYPGSITREIDGLVKYHTLIQGITVAATIFFSGLLLIHIRKGKGNFKIFQISTVVLIILDLWLFGYRYIIPVEPGAYSSASKWRFAKEDRDFFRVLALPTVLTTDQYREIDMLQLSSEGACDAVAYGIFNVQGGTTTLALREYHRFKEVAQFGNAAKLTDFFMLENYKSKLLSLLNIKYILSLQELKDEGLDLIQNGTIKVYRKKQFLPRVFLSHDIHIVQNSEDALHKINEPSFDPATAIVIQDWTDRMPIVSPSLNKEEWVTITDYSPNKVEVTARTMQDGFLVLSDVFFPGWKAYVDGKQSKIYRANYLFRSVYLIPGTHKVTFVYSPLSWKIGVILSLVTLFLVVIGLILKNNKRFL